MMIVCVGCLFILFWYVTGTVYCFGLSTKYLSNKAYCMNTWNIGVTRKFEGFLSIWKVICDGSPIWMETKDG
jgi:hypothetical protein